MFLAKRRMKLAIITALHERYRLTRLFLEYYQELQVPGVELGLFCAVTHDEHRMQEMLKGYPGWTSAATHNKPLTQKFAGCLVIANFWQPDAVMILGSDDFVSAGYIESAVNLLDGADFIGNESVHYMQLGTDQVIRQYTNERPIGAGRVLSRTP